MCGGTLVARASRNSVKLGFLLLLFSIAHLPLLRHADAKIVQGNLITSNVIIRIKLILIKYKTKPRVVSSGFRSMALLCGQYYCATCTSEVFTEFLPAVNKKKMSRFLLNKCDLKCKYKANDEDDN